MLHQEETLDNVCAAELKQNSSGCPKLGVSGLWESHRHAPAPFANPCCGAVGLAQSHQPLGSTWLIHPIHLQEGLIFPYGRAYTCPVAGDFSKKRFFCFFFFPPCLRGRILPWERRWWRMEAEPLGSLGTGKPGAAPRGLKLLFHLRAGVIFPPKIFPLAEGYLSSLLGIIPEDSPFRCRSHLVLTQPKPSQPACYPARRKDAVYVGPTQTSL